MLWWLKKVYTKPPVSYSHQGWTIAWCFSPFKILGILSGLSFFLPTFWRDFWRSLRVYDKFSFGFWIYRVTDRIVDSHDALHQYSDGIQRSYDDLLDSLPIGAEGFRLLKIEKDADPRAPLVLNLHSFPGRLDAPTYSALSYVWGAHEPPSYASINGYNVRLRSNLAQALLSLRRRGFSGYLWVDALCIHQSNLMERNHQVQLMNIFYGGAEQVIVSLAPEPQRGNTSYAEEGLGAIDRLINGRGRDSLSWDTPSVALVTQGLHEITSNEWFRRYWTVQEIALAKKVLMISGSTSIGWTSDPVLLRRAINRIKYAEVSPAWELHRMPKIDDFLDILYLQLDRAGPGPVAVGGGQTLLDVMHRLKKSNRKSTDPRDQIYAVMHLVDPVRLNGLRVDYSLTLSEIYEDVFSRIRVDDDDEGQGVGDGGDLAADSMELTIDMGLVRRAPAISTLPAREYLPRLELVGDDA